MINKNECEVKSLLKITVSLSDCPGLRSRDIKALLKGTFLLAFCLRCFVGWVIYRQRCQIGHVTFSEYTP